MATEPPKGLEVIKASYGVQGAFTDVTAEVTGLVKDGQLNFTVSPATFGILDPAPGVAKTFQANMSLNGAAPTLFTKNDAEQVVVNSPDVKPPKQDNSPMAQFQTTIWYGLMSLIGTYFIFSAYQFGTKGLGSSVVGIVFAIIVFLSTVKLALADSALGPAGLIGFVIGIAAVQIFWVFAISLFAPDFINFNWSSIPPPPIPEITGTEV